MCWGKEIRVFCKYAIKAGAKSAPGLLNVHGWMGMAGIDQSYVNDGWAVMAFDYCGQKDNRPHFTKYPAALDYGRMESKTIHAKLLNGKDITDPKQTSHYLWCAIQRRVLSYLLTQKEVDKTRIGAKGYSYGGTLMWNIGMDPRVKAIVAFFGIGWITYYRDHAVWMYNVPYENPPMTPGERLYLDTVECQAHAPCITAATLWLTGSNDHHSGHERSEQTFKMFKPGVPWSFAIQARGHHNTEKLGDDCKLWLEKYVLGKDIAWPDRPKSKLVLGQDGVSRTTRYAPHRPNTSRRCRSTKHRRRPTTSPALGAMCRPCMRVILGLPSSRCSTWTTTSSATRTSDIRTTSSSPPTSKPRSRRSSARLLPPISGRTPSPRALALGPTRHLLKGWVACEDSALSITRWGRRTINSATRRGKLRTMPRSPSASTAPNRRSLRSSRKDRMRWI